MARAGLRRGAALTLILGSGRHLQLALYRTADCIGCFETVRLVLLSRLRLFVIFAGQPGHETSMILLS